VRRANLIGLSIVLAATGGLLLYRHVYVEPRAWGAICAPFDAPFACVPRAWLLWLQYEYLWGLGGLALGVAAFLGAPFPVAVAAVAIGTAAVINYNVTWGMVGAVLGVWTWIRPRGASPV
jgi:hypothetical protein